MKGRRIYPNEAGEMWFAEGDYGKGPDGVWRARPFGASLGSLEAHEVKEHEDGTITVSPSVLISQGAGLPEWHGYLEGGVWRQA